MQSYDLEYVKTNREKKMTPSRRGRFWCRVCDASLVYIGQKCKVCGTINGKRTIKKETNA